MVGTKTVSGRRGSGTSSVDRSKSGTFGGRGSAKSRTRSKSPFRSFRWPKSKSPKSEGQSGREAYSDDEDNVPRSAFEQTDSDGLEAMLVRKHEWESTTKKASNRSWDKVCVVLRETKIEFYKDSKAYRSSPRDTYRGEDPIDIVGATSEIASDYKKKPHVFRLKLANCGEYLFQATSDEEMAQWVNAINQVAIQDEGAAGGAGRSQTLPEQGRKDEPKKRSFFTLKKK